MVAIEPSHKIDRINGSVIIRNLELFAGFDPEFDSDDDELASFDAKKIADVVKRTKQYMNRGQDPQLILRHNPDDPDKDGDRPVVGSIISIKAGRIGKAAGILGDVQMTEDDFDLYLKSNKYPRRSAEIWADGHLSEVALLGSETPARALPDTKFDKNDQGVIEKYRFARNFPPLTFGEKPMPDDDKMKKQLAEKDDEIAELKKQLKAKSEKDEDDDLKSKNQEDDDDEKSKNAQDDEDEPDKAKSSRRITALKSSNSKLEIRAEKAEKRLGKLEMRLQREQYGRKLDSLFAEGYQVGADDSEDRGEILTEIITSADPESKLAFLKKHIRKLTLRKDVNTTGARTGDAEGEALIEKQQQAAKSARDRVQEEADSTKDYATAQRKFGKFLKEEQKKLGIGGESTRRETG